MSEFALLNMEKIVGGHFMEHDKLHIASSRRDGTALVSKTMQKARGVSGFPLLHMKQVMEGHLTT